MYSNEQLDEIRKARDLLRSTERSQCFGAGKRGSEVCASTLAREAGIELPISISCEWVNCTKCFNGVVGIDSFLIHLNDTHRLSFKEIADELDKVLARSGGA